LQFAGRAFSHRIRIESLHGNRQHATDECRGRDDACYGVEDTIVYITQSLQYNPDSIEIDDGDVEDTETFIYEY
ncbi:MAG: hypothetical protein II001_04695, partial [Bacteroidales bacterium]|nr:hypothetical protein [Bacteroidales bacterium]